jgi:CRISPR type I-E-associated protein CasB/Cse2
MVDATAAAEPAAKDFIASLAGQVRHAGMGTLARLRRFDPLKNPQAALFETERMLMAAGVQPRDAQQRLRWALLLHCLALAQGRHDPRFDADPGAVLARLHVSEARLRQLVEADERVLGTLLPRLARRLAAAGATVNWKPLADLLLQGGPEDAAGRKRADEARHRLIRRYLDVQSVSRSADAADPTAA